jgi:hypothetical protein
MPFNNKKQKRIDNIDVLLYVMGTKRIPEYVATISAAIHEMICKLFK